MKKLLFITLGLLVSFYVSAQHTVALKHKQYQTVFDTVLKYPIEVSWVLTKESVDCKNKYTRTNKFVADPLLHKQTDLEDSYAGSGYDRGHNFPAADAACDSTSMIECFYFSNMTPQDPTVNRGDWKQLEELERNLSIKYDSVKVWCGSWGSKKKIGQVTVPTDCWKVIYIVKTKEWTAYHFYNKKSNSAGTKSHEVPLSFIEKQTHIKFK
jgi:endonuclease G